jgi:hypothetical protein
MNICAHKTVEGPCFIAKVNTRVLQTFLSNDYLMFCRDNSM